MHMIHLSEVAEGTLEWLLIHERKATWPVILGPAAEPGRWRVNISDPGWIFLLESRVVNLRDFGVKRIVLDPGDEAPGVPLFILINKLAAVAPDIEFVLTNVEPFLNFRPYLPMVDAIRVENLLFKDDEPRPVEYIRAMEHAIEAFGAKVYHHEHVEHPADISYVKRYAKERGFEYV